MPQVIFHRLFFWLGKRENTTPATWCKNSVCQILNCEDKCAKIARTHFEFVVLETQQHEGWFLWQVVFHLSDCIFSNDVISFGSNQPTPLMTWLNLVAQVPKEYGTFHFFLTSCILLRVSVHPTFVPWFVMCCLIHFDLSNREMRGQKTPSQRELRQHEALRLGNWICYWLLPDCVTTSTNRYAQHIPRYRVVG